ncbi:MAG: DNA polymerase IV [Coriobacteriia bacterium]|nr:DNA polymerase IV [Coriobacteriia bacterium]
MTETPHSCEGTPWEGRAILHVDLDAFFAAVEQLDHPEWRGKPVIVGGDPGHRGVVSTCSYEARKFGVRSAMSSARAVQLCPDAIWTHGSYQRYHEMSEAVRAIFADETPLVQPVSIDEAYLDVTPGTYTSEHPVAVARRIRSRVARLGITCSVGVSAIKSVAKIASDHDKPDGLTIVCPGEEPAFLAPLPTRAMPGVGPRTADRLEALGIRTLGQLAELDDVTALEVLGSHGVGIVARARGRDARSVHENEGVKSVSNERTFATDVRSPADVDGALAALAAKVGQRLRRKGLAGRTVTVKLRFSDFTTKTVRRTLAIATDDEAVFGPVARQLLASAWSPGIGLRLLGVGISGFDERSAQLDLFGEEQLGADTATPAPTPRERAQLVRGIDAVREKFGDAAVRYGRELKSPGRSRGDATDEARSKPKGANE